MMSFLAADTSTNPKVSTKSERDVRERRERDASTETPGAPPAKSAPSIRRPNTRVADEAGER